MKPEDLQPALEDAEHAAKTMAICHSLGDYQTLLETGSGLQRRHYAIGLYLAARTWCAYLHTFAPADKRTPQRHPHLAAYTSEEPEALHRLTYHLSHRTYRPPTDDELAAAASHAATNAPVAQDFVNICADEHPDVIDDRPVTTFLRLAEDSAGLGATMAQLCHATGRLLINHDLDEELARLTGDNP